MMRMRYVVLVLSVLLAAPMVSGSFPSSNLISYYSFENSTVSGSTVNNLVPGGSSITMYNSPTLVSGYWDDAYDLDGSTQYFSGSPLPYNDLSEVSYCYWFYHDNSGDDISVALSYNVPDGRPFLERAYTSKWWVLFDTVGFEDWWTATTVAVVTTWNHTCVTYKSGSLQRYIDGVVDQNTTSYTGDIENIDPAGHLTIGQAQEGGGVGNNWDGIIDEVAIWNRSLSAAEVALVFSGAYVPPESVVSFVDPTPDDGDTDNVQVTINVSCTLADTYYLWFNESNPPTYAVLDGASSGEYTTSVSISDTYYYKAGCYNSSTGGWSSNSSIRSWIYDIVSPVLSTDYTNNSVFVSGAANFTADFNFSDNFLIHSYNISVGDTQYYYNGSVDAESFNLSLSLSPADFSGLNTLNVTFADAHTTLELGEFDVKTPLFTNDYVRYEYEKEGFIKIKADSLFDTITTTKQKDRYVWDYKPSKVSNSYTFTVTSDKPLQVVNTPNGEYGGEYLISGDKWIDFVVRDNLESVSIILSDDHTAIVTVVGQFDKQSTLQFSSVGNLNVVEKDYVIFVIAGTEEYPVAKVETEVGEYKFNLTYNASLIGDIAATIIYNGTEYTPTKTIYSDYIQFDKSLSEGFIGSITNVSFLWNYTIYGYESLLVSDNFTEHNTTIYPFLIDNCTVYDTHSIDFTFENVNGTAISASLGGVISYWKSSESLSKNYTLSTGVQAQQSFCIYPYFTSLTANHAYTIVRSQYNNYNYVKLGDGLSNTTKTEVIEMTAASDTTDITFTVVDENDDVLTGYVLQTYRYDLSTNNYTLVDSQLTNTVGKVVIGLDIGAYQYMFYVLNPSTELIYSEPKSTLTELSYTFRVVLGTSTDSIALKMLDLDYTLTANRTNRSFFLTWNDVVNVGEAFMLRTLQSNASDDVVLDEQISYSNSSSLFYNVSNSSGIYTSTFYVLSSDDSMWYLINSVSIDVREEYELFGSDSYFMSFFFIGTIVMLGFFVSASAGVLLCIAGMIIFYAIGFYAVSLSGLAGLIVVLIIALGKLKRR